MFCFTYPYVHFLQKQLKVQEYKPPQQIHSLFSKWSHEKRAGILTKEELNTTNEEPDADNNAPDFENKVSGGADAFSPSWEKMIGWYHSILVNLWYSGVVTDVSESLTLQGLFLKNRRS